MKNITKNINKNTKMTRKELLFLKLIEECNEVSQRVCKGLKFGWDEVQPGQGLNNIQRLMDELKDVAIVWALLEEEGHIPAVDMDLDETAERINKVEKYFQLSKDQGILKD